MLAPRGAGNIRYENNASLRISEVLENGSVLQSVAAVLVMKSYEAILPPREGRTTRVDKITAATTVNKLEGGVGVGNNTLNKYFEGVLGIKQVEKALAAIKTSSAHRLLMQIVADRIFAEYPDPASEPHRRATKMMAALDAKTPTITRSRRRAHGQV